MRRPVIRLSVRGKVAVGLAFICTVSGCSMFHSNIRGGFACTAPDGSCAPTTVIDDAAIRSIQENPSSGDLALSTATANSTGAVPNVLVPGDQVAKDAHLAASLGGRALRVVFPAHAGAGGQIVPKRIAYARVDLTDWDGFQNEPTFTVDGKISTRLSKGLLGAAVNAPELIGSAGPTNQSAENGPSPSVAPSAASTSSPAVNSGTAWVDQVKAEAARVLKDAKATKSAGTFSTDGK